MSTALEIITDSYRESNINGIGVVPNVQQQTEGLRLLNNVISSVRGFEVGENLQDWPIGTVNYNGGLPGWSQDLWQNPRANSRLLVNVTTPQTVYLPTEPSDGARLALVDLLGNLAAYPLTIRGNGRLIEGVASVVVNTNSATMEWMYRADLGSWVRVSVLAIDTVMPFPTEFDAAFITMLAMRLNPRYGRAMAQESAGWMERSLKQLRARYHQTVVTPCDVGVLIMSVQAYAPLARGRYGWMV